MVNTTTLDDDGNIFFDDGPESQSAGDSSLVLGQAFDLNALKVYRTGELTVIGFADCDMPNDFCIAAYREQLYELVNERQCKMLTIDLSGLKLIPSGMLGLLVSLRKHVERIVLLNPSADIRDVLQVTHLDRLVELQSSADPTPS